MKHIGYGRDVNGKKYQCFTNKQCTLPNQSVVTSMTPPTPEKYRLQMQQAFTGDSEDGDMNNSQK